MKWTAVLFAVSQANQGLGLNTADTLFFLRFGVEFLPIMILLSGPVVMVGILAYAAGLGRIGAAKWLPIAFAGAGAAIVLERVGIFFDLPGVYPVVWLMGQVVMTVSLTAMWTTAGEVYTTRQAKRLFPLLASAGIAGGVVGNASTGPLARVLGTENVLLVQAGLLVAAAMLVAGLAARFFPAASEPPSDSVLTDFRSGLHLTMSNPLLKIAAGVGVAFSALLFLVVFPFSEIVTASFSAEAEVASYLGYFSAVATAATFLVSLFVTNRLFARLGVVATLMAVPLVYVGGFSTWIVSFGLVTATVVRGLQFVAVNAIGMTAWSSLFNVLTSRRRGQVMAFMAAGPLQLGTMLSGALLLAGSALPRQTQTVIGLVVALAAALGVWRMRSAYGSALVEAVRSGLPDVFTMPVAGLQKPGHDADTLRAMSACLDDARPEARVMAATSLARVNGEEASHLLGRALGDDDVRVRTAALEALGDRGWQEHHSTLLADPAPQVRRRVLEMALAGRTVAHAELTKVLADPDPSVRAMAAVVEGGTAGRAILDSLLNSDVAHEITVALEALQLRPDLTDADLAPFLDHPHRLVRASAAPLLATRSDQVPRVVNLLDDPSIVARRSAAKALARTREGIDALLTVLEGGSVRASDAALDALADTGARGPGLTAWASQEIARAAYLRRHRQALDSRLHPSATAGYLVRLLTAREERLERWAITALTTPDNEAAMLTVMRGLWSDIEETRSQAMEALDSLADRGVVGDLLSLLEEDQTADVRDRWTSLRELASDHDRWIRALAYLCLGEELLDDARRLAHAASRDPSPVVRSALARWELPLMHETETLDLMQRVLVLQQVPMFSAIDPEDLERIALVTTERHYQADEWIFREGEEGDEMLIIVSGEVVIARQSDNATVPVRSYGPGNHVGELALLRKLPRSFDGIAGADGVHTLGLGGSEVQAILEERPEVAMAMLGTLAERIATM
ncbi:MAG: HEAT repeat domain-containing protein [Acidimicrobiia bacterium]